MPREREKPSGMGGRRSAAAATKTVKKKTAAKKTVAKKTAAKKTAKKR